MDLERASKAYAVVVVVMAVVGGLIMLALGFGLAVWVWQHAL